MIYKTVSIGTILARMYRDLNLEDPNWENDAIEWSGEALEHIGGFPQYEKKDVVLNVTSHVAALPADLFHLEMVSYSPDENTTVSNFLDKPKYPLPRSGSKAHHGVHTSIAGERPIKWEESYVLNPDFIHTTFETGVIGISYLALPLDTFGYPKIPDNISYKTAIFWYILKQMILGGYKHVDPNINFVFAESRWQIYCTQARNRSNMPDIDEMEAFKDNWVRLVNRTDRGFNFLREQNVTIPTPVVYGNEHIDISLP